jgi:transcriptional regulator with XRE-family HTH domain
MSAVPAWLARNLHQLRKAKGLSQGALASKAGIPRSTLTHMESGEANPSLVNLLAVSQALGVNVEELLSRPRRAMEHISASDVPVQSRAAGRARIRKLLPDKVRGLHIDLLEVEAGSVMPGQPHLRGTKEYLSVLEGELTVVVGGEPVIVQKGDVLAFEGDQPHAYRNGGSRRAVAVSVVIPNLA